MENKGFIAESVGNYMLLFVAQNRHLVCIFCILQNFTSS